MAFGTDGPCALRVPRLRKDAERNRRLLINAAIEVLGEQGLDASLGEIARRAGVGNGTLYRRFPTREDLYAAVLAETEAMGQRIRREALEIEDGWTALVTYLEAAGSFAAANRGLFELMMINFRSDPGKDAKLAEGEQAMAELVARAQRQGTLRPDVSARDVSLAVCSMHMLIPALAAISPDAWRRHLALILDGLSTRPAELLPGSPLTAPQLREMVVGLFLPDANRVTDGT